MPDRPPHAILVTGAAGNLGRKLIAHCLAQPWCERIVALDVAAPADRPAEWDERVRLVTADLADAGDRRWQEAFDGVEAALHLAARNPAPNAPWDDACASFDMTLHVAGLARRAGLRRLVFASSNHTMGRYKDSPLADGLGAGDLATSRLPGPGTRWFNGQEIVDGVAYGTSKLLGERVCVSEAELSGGALTSVSVRIGWCQPAENRPETINASGVSRGVPADHPDAARDLRWFRNMWLSNRDFLNLMERALVSGAEGWPSPGIVVNGMSANAGMAWDIETTKRLLGYEPKDDLWAEIA